MEVYLVATKNEWGRQYNQYNSNSYSKESRQIIRDKLVKESGNLNSHDIKELFTGKEKCQYFNRANQEDKMRYRYCLMRDAIGLHEQLDSSRLGSKWVRLRCTERYL